MIEESNLKVARAHRFGKYVDKKFHIYYVHENAIASSGALSIASWKERLEAISHDVMELSMDIHIRKYEIQFIQFSNSVYPIKGE